MKLGQLVLRLRSLTTIFSGRVGGAAEYVYAKEHTLNNEMCFVIPLQESANENKYDSGINQIITEQFAVVVAIKNDVDYEDKTGFSAYNRLHTIRTELFSVFLGYDMGLIISPDEFTTNSLIYYKGGQLLDFDRSYLWYQYTFEYQIGIESGINDLKADGYLDKIFAEYELMPSDNIPYSDDLPVELFKPDMQQMVNLVTIREEEES